MGPVNSLASLSLAIKEKLMFDEPMVFRRQLRRPGDEFGRERTFSGIADLLGSLTTEEIPRFPVILRRKHQTLVQRASAMPLVSGVLFGSDRLGWILGAGSGGTVNAGVCMDV